MPDNATKSVPEVSVVETAAMPTRGRSVGATTAKLASQVITWSLVTRILMICGAVVGAVLYVTKGQSSQTEAHLKLCAEVGQIAQWRTDHEKHADKAFSDIEKTLQSQQQMLNQQTAMLADSKVAISTLTLAQSTVNVAQERLSRQMEVLQEDVRDLRP
jgi:hypothetical protein